MSKFMENLAVTMEMLQLIHSIVKDLSKLLNKNINPVKREVDGYLSAAFDADLNYRKQDFRYLPTEVGLERIKGPGIPSNIYGRGDEFYLILVEPITLEEFFMSYPDLELPREARDAVVFLNVKVTPLSSKALENLGKTLVSLAVELVKMRGTVNVKVTMYGVGEVQKPKSGTIYRHGDVVTVVFHDFTELREYRFTPTLKQRILQKLKI